MDDIYIYGISDNLYDRTNSELLKEVHLNRDKLIKNNIKLVIHQVKNKFGNVNYEKKDLVSIGIIGLIKAVDTFDITRKVEFSTYAVRCINNEILLFLRNLKKYQYEKNLSQTLNDNDGLELIDNLASDVSLEEDYCDKEQILILRKIVSSLPDRERKLIKLYFGFGIRMHTQKEISKIFNVSQAQVSKMILTTLEQIKNLLEILDVNGESRYKKITKRM